MSDTTDTPRERKPLGLKRSIDAGEVKQTFSHGRTNKVVVEVKRLTPAWPAVLRDFRGAQGVGPFSKYCVGTGLLVDGVSTQLLRPQLSGLEKSLVRKSLEATEDLRLASREALGA